MVTSGRLGSRVAVCVVEVEVLLLVGLGLAGPAHADVTGKWAIDQPVATEFVDFTQMGNSIAFSLFFGTPFSGSRLPPALFSATTPPSPGIFACGGSAIGVIPSTDRIMRGFVGVPPCQGLPAGSGPISGMRCQCFDGNTINGDGCDDHCQIEPCFTCSGDPSVCTPTPDGGACDDGHVCTTGETCTAGVCGGGSMVSPCVDLSGRWLFHQTLTVPITLSSTYQITIQQRGTDLEIGGNIGDIDPATGSFQLYGSADPDHICFLTNPDSFEGSSSDNKTLHAVYTQFMLTPGLGCGWYDTFEFEITGTRCGGGTLDPDEECDDGNDTPGDGCDATCHVETCYECTGEPSVCAPQSGTSCDDGDACTENDICTAGSCAGTALACEACLACSAGACVPTPRTGCRPPTDPTKSILSVNNKSVSARDRFLWKWRPGNATLADFGDPVHTDAYALCVYDESDAAPALLFRAQVPAGGSWDTNGTHGFTYHDANAQTDGVQALRLRGSPIPGDAKILAKGKGPGLSGRPFGLPAPPLSLPLRVQLQGDNDACFEARYTQAAVNNGARGRFKAHGQ